MRLILIHFSQDFRENKSQLGGYSRILNLCKDGNIHYIFTPSFSKLEIDVRMIQSNTYVVDIPCSEIDFRFRNYPRTIFKLSKSIADYLITKSIKVDLFFGHSQLINYFILRKVRNLYNQSVLLLWEMNAIWGFADIKGFRGKLMNLASRGIQSIVLRSANHVIVHSFNSKDFVSSRFSIKREKLSVVTNSVDEKEITNPSEKPLCGSIRKKFLCIGFFDKMNGIPFIIEYLKNNPGKIDVYFFGDGPFQSMVKELAFDSGCYFGGSVSRDQMHQLYKEFHYIIIPRLPQLEADLFIPTKLLEALAAGVVPICSDVSGMSEVVKNDLNGFVFKAGDHVSFDMIIDRVLETSEVLYMKIRASGVNTIIDHYSLQHNVSRLNECYSKMLQLS